MCNIIITDTDAKFNKKNKKKHNIWLENTSDKVSMLTCGCGQICSISTCSSKSVKQIYLTKRWLL